jgi:hypothetical protein
VRPEELTLGGVLRQFFGAVSSVDGRVIRSLRTVLTRPGALTVAYVAGPRKPYLGPFQLFLLANVVFVALQSIFGMNVFSSTLESHLHQQDWSDLAQRLTAQHVASAQTTLEAYAPVFNRRVAFLAKTLVITMAIPFTLLLPVLFFRKRRSFGVHAIFAVHAYSFLLLLFCAALIVAAIDVLCGGRGLDSPRFDHVVSPLNLIACVVYLYVAIGAVYGTRGAVRIVTALTLGCAVGAIVLGYRFVLFLLALWLT